MPAWALAKHPETGVQPEFQQWAEQLKTRLFGVQKERT